MKPNFALTFTDDGIGLLHRTSRGWLMLGDASMDDPALSETIGFLRTTALGLEPNGIATKLFMPDAQILFTRVEVTAAEGVKRRNQIKRALEGLTPYAVDDLVFDWTGTGSPVQVAVIARETLEEAEGFARDHRLNPVEFAARLSPGRFDGEPHFGPTALALSGLPKGKRPDLDRENLPILGQPEPTMPAETVIGQSEVLEAPLETAPEFAAEAVVEPPADLRTTSLVDLAAKGIIETAPAAQKSPAAEPMASAVSGMGRADEATLDLPDPGVEAAIVAEPAPEWPAASEVKPVAAGPVAAGPVAAGPVAAGPVAAEPVLAAPSFLQDRFAQTDPGLPGPEERALPAYAASSDLFPGDDIPEAPAMFDVPSDDSDLDEPVMEPLPQAKFASSREVGPTPARAQTPPDRPDPVAARMAFSAEPREALLARAGFADASADVNAPSLPKSSVSLPPLVAPARGAKNGTPGRVSDPRAKGPAKDFGKAAGGMARFVPMKQKAAKSLPNGGDSAARIAAMSAAIAAPTKVPPAQDLLRQGLGTRPVQQRGKPRYLGLVLTLILIAVLAAAALWATFLQESPAVTSEAPANAPTDTGSTVVTQAAPSAVADATGTDIEAPVPLAPAAASISPDVEVVTGVAPQDPTLQDPSQQNTPLPDAGTQIAGTQDPALPESDQATEPAAEQIVSTTPLPDTVRPLPRPERLASALPTQERAVAAVPAVANAERSVSTASGPVTEAGPALLAALPGASDSGTGSATDVALPHSGPEGTANANLSEPARLGQTSPGQPRLGQSAPDASPLHEAAREAVVVADPAAAAAQTGGEATTLAEPAQGADITPTLPAIATPGLTQLASRAVPAPLVPPQTAENDAKPASPVPPAPFGLFFDRDASGFVIATTDGALTPEGAVVFAGRPKLVPPTRLATAVTDLVPTPAVGADASPAATAIEAAPFSTDTAPPIGADPALSGFRPKLRPASLISPGDQTLTVVVPLAADATTIRPKPRPVGLTGADNPGLIGSTGADQGLADPGLADPGLVDPALADPGTPLQDQAAALDQTKAFASASPLAVAASRRPGQRPKDFTASVTAALAAAAPALEPETAAAPQVASLAPAPRPEVPVVKLAIKPEAAAPAEPQKRAVDEGDAEPELASAAPSIPTKASVAKQATETNAISLKVVNLIGVYGSSADRHALVRLASGKYLRLKVGDRVDGGQVAAIGEQELRYVKNGKNLILALPKEG